MLPKTGTKQRAALEEEALAIGEGFLRKNAGEIATTLYDTYSHFRLRFLEERGFADGPPDPGWDDCLRDATILRNFVSTQWAARVLDSRGESGLGDTER